MSFSSFLTVLEPISYPFGVKYRDSILSLGSCFASHISSRLSSIKYKLVSNPTGITFNPASLRDAIKMATDTKTLQEDQILSQNGLYNHFKYHSSFNHTDRGQAFSAMQKSIDQTATALQSVDYVIITIGTCIVFRHKSSGQIVNNCHKFPAQHFDKELLSVSQTIDTLEEIRDLITGRSSSKVQFIYTVSPVRHIKNGLVLDRKSKSTALLAVHHMSDNYADCHYFPSYEILTDMLRDYRYYAADMIHPSEVAIDYIYKTFSEAMLDQGEAQIRKDIASILRRENHRPLFPDSDSHQKFLTHLATDKKALIDNYPWITDRL